MPHLSLYAMATLLAVSAVLLPVRAEPTANPGVVPVQTRLDGHSYGEWGAAWLQWLYAIPPAENPMLESSGAHCGAGQSGPVWFLAGATGEHPVNRKACEVPAGKTLFVPLRPLWFFNDVGWSRDAMRAYDEIDLDLVTHLSVTVDGVAIEDPWRYRANSGYFPLHLPEGGFADTAPDACGPDTPGGDKFPCVGDFETYLDGYWLLLRPLPPGEHTIDLRVGVSGPKGGRVWFVRVLYSLTVVPDRP